MSAHPGRGCVASSGYPSENYGNDEVCFISDVPAVPLTVLAFDVEAGPGGVCMTDAILSNFDQNFEIPEVFCGSAGPSGVVLADGLIIWVSSPSGTRPGWEICWSPPQTPLNGLLAATAIVPAAAAPALHVGWTKTGCTPRPRRQKAAVPPARLAR